MCHGKLLIFIAKMRGLSYSFLCFYLTSFVFNICDGASCGCKTMQPCYQKMLDHLRDGDEASCVEDASFGTSGVMIYLTALTKFCGEVVTVNSDAMTFEERKLYEVIIARSPQEGSRDSTSSKPTILVDAGQQGGSEPISFALYIIQQLVACKENSEMIAKTRWVILPNTNPDGSEYARFSHPKWTKNLRATEDKMAFGVDISRNFDFQWGSCSRSDNVFAATYAGSAPGSENETIFIKNVMDKNKANLIAYISLRRNGHAILYPTAFTKPKSVPPEVLKAAGEIASKVNMKAGSVQAFTNESIYEFNGEAHCGHSVDYANDIGVTMSFEMRIFPNEDNQIMSNFQSLPRGYETSLRSGYFSGIKTLYNILCVKKRSNYYN